MSAAVPFTLAESRALPTEGPVWNVVVSFCETSRPQCVRELLGGRWFSAGCHGFFPFSFQQ